MEGVGWELISPIRDILMRAGNFALKFVYALVIFGIGLLIAKVLEWVVVKVLKTLRVDLGAEKLKITEFLSKGGIRKTLSEICGVVVYWVIALGVLISSLNILGLQGVTLFLDEVLGYVPSVVWAMIVLVLGFFVANLLASVVRTAASNAGIDQAAFLANLTQVIIIIFAVAGALKQLNLELVGAALNIVLASVGLAVAIAVGFGCQDLAGKMVSDLIEKLKRK
jgi:hypothetical protein